MIEKNNISQIRYDLFIVSRRANYWLFIEKIISSFYETAIYVYIQNYKDILLSIIVREKKFSRPWAYSISYISL